MNPQSLLVALLLVFGCVGCEKDADKSQQADESQPPSASTQGAKDQGTQPVITPKPAASPSANETFLKTMAAARKQACSVLCEKTAPLKCGAEAQCAEGCFESFNLPVCMQEMEQFLTCSTNAPLSDFVCNPDTGAAALKDGVCDAEQANIIRCMSQSLDPTPTL